MKPSTKAMRLQTLLSLSCLAQHATAKAVFAHFMIGNTQHFDVDRWTKHITTAAESRIDAFVLNMAHGDPLNNGSVSDAFEAANKLGSEFKLIFSFDYAGNGTWPKKDVLAYITEYQDNDAYYYHDGQPFVSTFEGPDAAADWIDLKKETDCFFVPTWSSLGAKVVMEKDENIVDGLFNWGAWPDGPHDMTVDVDESYIYYLNGSSYMMPVSPWFYTNMPGYDKNWLWRGDDLWYDRWQQVIEVQPDFVEIISWNDFGESHYIGPLDDTQYVAFELGKANYNYAKNMPHDGWRTFLPYVIEMYKNGNTSQHFDESLVSWYRLTPGDACDADNTTGNTYTYQTVYEPAKVSQDKVFFSALLNSSADVQVTIGDVTRQVAWDNKPNTTVGIYHGSIPFDGNTGKVTVTVHRDGNEVLKMKGESITTKCKENITNWNAWVGSAPQAEWAETSSGASMSTPIVWLTCWVILLGTVLAA